MNFKLWLENEQGILNSIYENPTDELNWNALNDYLIDQGKDIDIKGEFKLALFFDVPHDIENFKLLVYWDGNLPELFKTFNKLSPIVPNKYNEDRLTIDFPIDAEVLKKLKNIIDNYYSFYLHVGQVLRIRFIGGKEVHPYIKKLITNILKHHKWLT